MADGTRPLRGCEVCGQVDTAPRHVHGVAPGQGVVDQQIAEQIVAAAADPVEAEFLQAQVTDTSTWVRHIDCCASVGCPDGSCAQIVADSGGLTGDALVAWLTKG